MKVFFNTCHEAINNAITNNSFGLYYSKTFTPNLLIHTHDCCEIFFSLSDGNYFLIEDKVYTVNKNDLFILNKFEAHKVNATGKSNFTRYSLHIHPEFIISNSSLETNLYKLFTSKNKIDKIHLDDIEADSLSKLFESLTTNYEYADTLYKKIRTIEILIEVNNFVIKRKTNNNDFDDKIDERLIIALDFINKNFTQQITLSDIAKHCFISVNLLCKLFKNLLSTTVNKYIISLRITLAKKYLIEGKSVTETALSCGFNDYANFIRVFKNTVGFPPGKYKSSI